MSKPRLTVRWLRDGALVEAGSVAIIVDVLRASTSITTMLQRGASEIAVTRKVEEARELAEKGGGLLVGERKNRRIEGFDFGSSPAELQGADLAGARIVFTSTNFPHALHAARHAREIFIGAVVNVAAVTEAAAGAAESSGAGLCIMLAGEPVEPHAFEDWCFAGLSALRLEGRCELGETAHRAAEEIRGMPPEEVARRSKHAGELMEDGFRRDVEFALVPDRFGVVGRVAEDGLIRRR